MTIQDAIEVAERLNDGNASKIAIRRGGSVWITLQTFNFQGIYLRKADLMADDWDVLKEQFV